MVGQAAAKNLVPCILELGGKSPVIIDKSANLRLAASKLAFGAFLNFGQLCVRPDYCLIEDSIRQDFLKELKKAMQQYEQTTRTDHFGKAIN